MEPGIVYQIAKPAAHLADLVDSFWMLINPSAEKKPVVVVPDGRFDLFFSYAANEPYHVTLSGLGSEPSPSWLEPQSVLFAVSFNLLAVEYVLDTTIAGMVNETHPLPTDFWGLTPDELTDLNHFQHIATQRIERLLKKPVAPRKQALFKHLYATHGNATVGELAEVANWSPRQINRYFSQCFGLSLKAYCTILRFRASFDQIKAGRLFPEQDFADQSHFIHDVRKFAGVSPKELVRNTDDRFIQFSTLPPK